MSDDDVPGGTILMALVGTDVNAPVALLHGPAEGDYVAGLIGAEVLGQVLGDTWQAIFDEDARGKDLPELSVEELRACGLDDSRSRVALPAGGCTACIRAFTRSATRRSRRRGDGWRLTATMGRLRPE